MICVYVIALYVVFYILYFRVNWYIALLVSVFLTLSKHKEIKAGDVPD